MQFFVSGSFIILLESLINIQPISKLYLQTLAEFLQLSHCYSMSFRSLTKWWRSPLPPSFLAKLSNRFALIAGAGLAFAGVTMTTLNAIGGGLGYAQKFELSEQSCLTRKKIADKLGLPSPLSRQDLNCNYPSAASVYYPRTNAGTTYLIVVRRVCCLELDLQDYSSLRLFLVPRVNSSGFADRQLC